MDFSDIEREVVVLKAVTELIDSVVNREVLDLLGDAPHSQVTCRTQTHQKYFNIVLVDFLSLTDKSILPGKKSFLARLRDIADRPHFDTEDSVCGFREATNAFSTWLKDEIQVEKVWLPSIDTETDLTISRISFLKVCGNISKHNVLRSGLIAKEIKSILHRSGVTIDLGDALRVLSRFLLHFAIS